MKNCFKPGDGKYFFVENKTQNILLVKPSTGMNASGIAVRDIINNWKINLSDLYIIFDDIDLPLGKLRLRSKGGDGCHRGMESIIYHLGNNQFPRIRFGIATNDRLRPSEKYVLKSFNKEDQLLANETIIRAADAAESIIFNGITKTMNQYNA
jgi:Peptidyl-tRNA hydrolase